MIYNTFTNWYRAAQAATVYGGAGTPLTTEELAWFQNYTAPYYDKTWGGISEATAIRCFPASQYSDPRDINAEEFLSYCPSQVTLGSGARQNFSWSRPS